MSVTGLYRTQFVAFSVALLLGTAAMADEAGAGKSLYNDLGCIYCHGEAGRKPALGEYPKLAGQNADYIAQQARDIRSGIRSNRYSAMMQAAVANVTDAQIEAIARYLAEQEQ